MVNKTVNFGSVDGQEITLFTISNSNGYEMAIMNYGGIITRFVMPDKTGKSVDICLGFNTLAEYLSGHPFFGAIIGRYGNRIGAARFVLDGTEYRLPVNDGPNTLHGGIRGFDKRVWEASSADREHASGVRLTYTSCAHEEGFPGNLNVTVTYWLTEQNELEIEYAAETDAATVVSLTNHAYWNLAGEGSGEILSHILQINSDAITRIGAGLIPDGALFSVAGTPFDFTVAKPIGRDIGNDSDQIALGGGYDHNWVLKRDNGKELVHAATLSEPESGRTMEVFTTEPGIQFYSGNFLDGTLVGKRGTPYVKRSGLCLETQHFPDSPNHPDFPSTVLRPGEIYNSKTVHRFSIH